MTNNLLFEFTVDKSTSTVFVTREFNAGLTLVWMLLPGRKFLTNGGRRNHLLQEQNP